MSAPEKPKGPIVIESLPWTEFSHGARFATRFKALSDTQGGARKIGVLFEELPPGKQSSPFHFHMAEEEHIVALEGEATLRLGDERYMLRAGEYVGFPAGQRAGHCLINETDKPFRYLVIGDREPHDVCVYPDSGKVMLRSLDRAILRDRERLGYWDGEEAD